jgi:hypothetical protein
MSLKSLEKKLIRHKVHLDHERKRIQIPVAWLMEPPNVVEMLIELAEMGYEVECPVDHNPMATPGFREGCWRGPVVVRASSGEAQLSSQS